MAQRLFFYIYKRYGHWCSEGAKLSAKGFCQIKDKPGVHFSIGE